MSDDMKSLGEKMYVLRNKGVSDEDIYSSLGVPVDKVKKLKESGVSVDEIDRSLGIVPFKPVDGWQPTSYGFKVKPIDLAGGKQSVQREDNAVWFGEAQGNKGKPGWFNAEGERVSDIPLTKVKLETGAIVPKRSDDAVYIKATDDPRFKGQEGWHYYDKNTGMYAPAPSYNPNEASFLQRNLGIETWKDFGRQIKAGITKPAEGIAQKVVPEGSEYGKALAESQRYRKALANTGMAGSGFIQDVAASVPEMAMLSVVPGAAPGATMVERFAANAVPAAAMSYATAPKGEEMSSAVGALAGGAIGEGVHTGVTKLMQKGESLAPEKVVAWFKSKVKGKPSDVLQEDLRNAYNSARKEVRDAFEVLKSTSGNNDVPLSNFEYSLENMIKTNKASRGSNDSMERELTAIKNKIEQSSDKSFASTVDLGTELNEVYKKAMESGDGKLMKAITNLKSDLQYDMDLFGKQFGDAYVAAKNKWVEKLKPWEDPREGGRILQSFIKSPTPDLAMTALLKAKSEDKIDIFMKQLSKNIGVPALQAGLVEDVYKQSLRDGTVIPQKFITALKNRQDAYGLSFSGREKWMMDGLNKLMKDSRFTAQMLTGEWLRHLPLGRVLPGSAYPSPEAGSILQKLFTTPTGQKLLVKSYATTPGSKTMGKIIDDIERFASLELGKIASELGTSKKGVTNAAQEGEQQ